MHYPASDLVIDPVLIRKYDTAGPRYASYPTADRFIEAFGETELRQWLAKRKIGGITQLLSLSVHLPFRNTVYCCASNTAVMQDHGRSAKYSKYLARELALLSQSLGTDRTISQLHWGGGMPTSRSRGEMRELMRCFDVQFERCPNFECSIEVDARSVEAGTMGFLAELGFNHVSTGIQDLDADVENALQRIQSEEQTRHVIEEARTAGFRSVNLDLIYGLPKQTLNSFDATLDQVLALDPDRIALYSYVHLPRKLKPQRCMVDSELPSLETKLQILTLVLGRLTRAGYLYIGMDLFAKPDDELAVAQRQGRLQRNVQGYSTHPRCDMLGLGVSAIGRIGPTYSQNVKTLKEYYMALDAGRLPVQRGLVLTKDDLVRRAVIQALACHFRLAIESIESSYLVDFGSHFSTELEDLRRLEEDGLVELQPDWIVITPKGRVLVRAVCMVFDRYLREHRQRESYSRVI